ncbi:NRDE family protein [Empedobacter falsenii]|uniref:NRDE family protein n=1 Tax=unclassified Empedobacter TaxID=2643773 RepID=UPI002577024B|nr:MULTISPECIES: NRDE family protein [unclassified Empedobacter]MDM1522140.1 NRDE family protein [Empedobacter sp. 225-1]MDM1542477.1 NRDE family protein [Empedobacter sp. 189-2]
MCIVSFYRNDDEFVLTHNRDEEISRSSSNEIVEQIRFGKTYFSPVDERAKGTWMFYSEQYVACILNGGIEKPLHFKEQYRESRGIILLDLLKYNTVKEFVNSENLSEIAPFTIFVFERTTKNAYLLFWNENELSVKDVSQEKIVTWCSSTLYSPERRNEIDQIIQSNSTLSSEEIIDLHDQLKMNKGDLYDFLATTSISQIFMNSLRIDMKYCQLF